MNNYAIANARINVATKLNEAVRTPQVRYARILFRAMTKLAIRLLRVKTNGDLLGAAREERQSLACYMDQTAAADTDCFSKVSFNMSATSY